MKDFFPYQVNLMKIIQIIFRLEMANIWKTVFYSMFIKEKKIIYMYLGI